MDHSIFMDKASIPTDENLKLALGTKYELWMEIRARVFQKYPDGKEEWNFPGKMALKDIFSLIDIKLAH